MHPILVVALIVGALTTGVPFLAHFGAGVTVAVIVSVAAIIYILCGLDEPQE